MAGRYLVLLSVFLAAINPARAEGTAGAREGEIVSFTADCGPAGCREGGTTLEIKRRDGVVIPISVLRSPYVMADGTIVIYPGEELRFDFPNAGDTLGTPHLLAKGEDAPAGTPTLVLDYKVDEEHAMMELLLKSGFTKTVKLDAYLGFPSGDDWKLHHTSTCALLAHISGFETWPAPLGPIFISNIRYLPANSVMSCN